MQEQMLIHTFCSQDLAGSPQWLHLYDSLDEQRQGAEHAVITDDYDHSFVYWRDDHCAEVIWRNKAGPIQCCGSGAYALSTFLQRRFNVSQWQLHTDNDVFSGRLSEGKVLLSLAVKPVVHVSIAGIDSACYVAEQAGIYLVEVDTITQLHAITNSASYKKLIQHKKVHGLAFFTWDAADKTGGIRYFVPKYGRDEDTVTGSLHQYLSPLVQLKYQTAQQRWIQYSESGGLLNSKVSQDAVEIFGQCQWDGD